MRSDGRNVKSLARGGRIWHRAAMSDDSDAKQKQRSERLREALRANLRRRKGMPGKPVAADPSCPKPAD